MGFRTCRATATTVSLDDETSAAGIAKPTSQALPDAAGHRRRHRQLAAVQRQLVQRQQRAQRRKQLVDTAELRRIARRPHQHKHQAGDSRTPRAPLLRRQGLLNGAQKRRNSASWQQHCARHIQQAGISEPVVSMELLLKNAIQHQHPPPARCRQGAPASPCISDPPHARHAPRPSNTPPAARAAAARYQRQRTMRDQPRGQHGQQNSHVGINVMFTPN